MKIDAHLAAELPRQVPSEEIAARATGSGSVYRADIDGLRAVAALSVVGVHVGIVGGGFVGVDMFFVISGYLISGIILRAVTIGQFSFLDFYSRRVRRIFPAFALVLISVLTASWFLLLDDEFRLLGKTVAASAAFCMNLVQWPQQYPWLLSHTWSLSVEEQFYLVWPLFLCIAWRWGRHYLLHIVVMATAVSFGIDVVTGMNRPIASYLLPWARIWQLSLGCVLACLEMQKLRPLGFHGLPLPNSDVRSVIGASLIVGSLIYTAPVHMEAFPTLWKVPPTLGTFLLMSSGPRSWINRNVLSWNPIVFLGLISYPLYLWHAPVLRGLHVYQGGLTPLSTVSAVLISVMLSIGTYKFVEMPLRSSDHGWLKTSLLSAVLAACGISGYLVFAGIAPSRSQPEAIDNIVSAASEEFLPMRSSWQESSDGFWVRGSSPRFVLYVGDSSMMQYYPRIDHLLTEHPHGGRSVLIATREGCVPGAVSLWEAGGPNPALCQEFLEKLLRRATRPEVETVVIAASWFRYLNNFPGDRAMRPQADKVFRATQDMVEALVQRGKRVYLILNIPVDPRFDPHRMIRRRFQSPGFFPALQLPKRADVENALAPVSARLVRIAELSGASVIDPMHAICDDDHCRVIASDGKPVYRDMWHWRPSFVQHQATFIDKTLFATGHKRALQ